MLIFLDTETTGVDKAKLVQLAYKLYSDDGELDVNELYKPPVPIEIGAMAVHHITNEAVKDKSAFAGSAGKEILESYLTNHVLVAHNAKFDLDILKNEGVVLGKHSIDTLQVAKHLFEGLDSYQLQYLRYYFGITNLKVNAHDAMGDVIVLRSVFRHLAMEVQRVFKISDRKQVIAKMITLSTQHIIFEKMPFGKYKGQELKLVTFKDNRYFKWLYEQEITKEENLRDMNVIGTIKHYLKI